MTITRTEHDLGEGLPSLSVFTVTGARPGPVFATIGAIHGDEYEGPVVLSGLLDSIDPAEMSGTWIVVPVANRNAVAAAARCSPADGKNLARRFPGDPAGSYTDRLADLIHRHVIAPADCVLDLHSGGNALESAFFAGYADDTGGIGDRARGMAHAFGADYVWRHAPPQPGGRTMSSCSELGKPGVYVECSGGSFPVPDMLAAYREGVLGILAHLGMLPPRPSRATPRTVTGSGDLDTTGPSPATGLCTAHVSIGQRVSPGDLMFSITDLDGAPVTQVRATAAGIVMFARRNRWVETGEPLTALAVDDTP